MNAFLSSILIVCGVGILTSCTSVNTVERAVPLGERQMTVDKRVITDPSLSRRVKILGVNESEGVGGFLKVQLEVLNTTRKRQSFHYRVEWFDASGNLITSPPSTLISRQIEGRESLFLSATAPTQNAKDFRIKLIENS